MVEAHTWRPLDCRSFLQPCDSVFHHQSQEALLASVACWLILNWRARRIRSAVSRVDDLAVAPSEHANLESKLADRRDHAIDSAVVFARVARTLHEVVDRPLLDVRDDLRGHNLLWRKEGSSQL